MSDPHPMQEWARRNGISLPGLAEAVGCSESHLRNIFAGRKEPSLGLAHRLHAISRREISVETFLRDEASA